MHNSEITEYQMRNARESYSRAFFMFYNIFLNIISKILEFASPTCARTAAVTQNGSMDTPRIN